MNKVTELDLTENAVYIVKDGLLTRVNGPVGGYGTDEIVWQKGRVLDVIRSQRNRIEGQKEI